ncbi:MAG: branched-chain amino acid ABC transporter permease [Rhizobiaceae bacterium]
MDFTLVVDIVTLACVYALFTIGLSLAWGVLDVLNLAHGAIFMTAALVGYIVTQNAPLPLLALIAVGVVVGAAITLSVEILVFQQVRRNSDNARVAELSTAMASVGAGAVMIGMAQFVTEGNAVAIKTSFPIHVLRWGGVAITNLQIIIIATAIVLTTAVALLISRTGFGRAMRALAVDPYVCGLLGVSAPAVSRFTMAVSGALAGSAGVLLALYQNGVNEHMGNGLLLKAFAIVVVGGVGNIWGAALGGLMLAGAEVVTVMAGGGRYVDAVAFAIILLVLVLRPGGLLPAPKWDRA